jgi:tripartite-type tricarboxylate transporter receptor subunit TctC
MRKSVISAAVLSALLIAGGSATARAQQKYPDKYPSQDVHFICGFPPGSGADILVRHFAEKIARKIGHTIIVENKTGAGGMLALTQTARAQPTATLCCWPAETPSRSTPTC